MFMFSFWIQYTHVLSRRINQLAPNKNKCNDTRSNCAILNQINYIYKTPITQHVSVESWMSSLASKLSCQSLQTCIKVITESFPPVHSLNCWQKRKLKKQSLEQCKNWLAASDGESLTAHSKSHLDHRKKAHYFIASPAQWNISKLSYSV